MAASDIFHMFTQLKILCIPLPHVGEHRNPDMNFRFGGGVNFLIKCSYHGRSPMPNRTALRLNCCFWKNTLPRALYSVGYL